MSEWEVNKEKIGNIIKVIVKVKNKTQVWGAETRDNETDNREMFHKMLSIKNSFGHMGNNNNNNKQTNKQN